MDIAEESSSFIEGSHEMTASTSVGNNEKLHISNINNIAENSNCDGLQNTNNNNGNNNDDNTKITTYTENDCMVSSERISGDCKNSELWGGFKQSEVVLLMLQAMDTMGYSKAREALEKESGVQMESDIVKELHSSIMSGVWDYVIKCLNALPINSLILSACHFLVYEQHYLELLFKKDIHNAITCLREKLCKACFDSDTTTRMHHHCVLLMVSDTEDLQQRSVWRYEQSRFNLWLKIAQLVPPYLIIPPRRLETLLLQSYKLQELHCLYHNTAAQSNSGYSLLTDHHCYKQSLPAHCYTSLDGHTDEVWVVAVSPDLRYIASASKDKSIILWSINDNVFKLHRQLLGHEDAISYISWSEDNTLLASAAQDSSIAVWSVDSAKHKLKFEGHHDNVTFVIWLGGNTRFVSAGSDKCLTLWKLTEVDGVYRQSVLHKWTFTARLQDCAVSYDSSHIIVVTVDKHIRLINTHTYLEEFTLPENDVVYSISSSSLHNQLLVNVADQKPVIRLWDMTERRVVQRYRGHRQGRFVIRSAFGGPNEAFVISGSEDSQVYIWHRFYGSLLEVLAGHAATVNAVIWPHTNNCEWMVSVSDDHTLLIWQTNENVLKHKEKNAILDDVIDDTDMNDD